MNDDRRSKMLGDVALDCALHDSTLRGSAPGGSVSECAEHVDELIDRASSYQLMRILAAVQLVSLDLQSEGGVRDH